jgi:hypothetical protein
LYTLLIVTNDLGSDYSSCPTLAVTDVQDGDEENPVKSFLESESIHQEQMLTFWRWKIYVTLMKQERYLKYSINGSQEDIGFWIPAFDQSMRMVFHTCNGN